MHTSRDSALYIPAQPIHPVMDRVFVGSEMQREVFGCARNAVQCVENRSTLVDTLRLSSGPSTIRRFVRAVVVDAVNRMGLRWFWSHIGVEVSEVAPAFAHGNAPAAVVGEASMVRITTSVEQSGPCGVFGRMPQAMRGLRLEHLAFDASAGMRAVQVAALNQLL